MAKAGLIADYEPTSRLSGRIIVPARDAAADASGLLGPTADATNQITAEDIKLIAERVAMGGVVLDQERIWGFRGIASTDAIDSYFTRPDVERALKPYAEDLKTGTAVLGNHDYDKFGYGSSYDGEVVDVEARDLFVDGNPEYGAKKGTLGKYYIVKGLSLNGEKTDDLITAAKYGALRRLSVTFYPRRYECSLDGKDMMEWECEHFPGVRYGDKKELCYAWIQDSRLLETSLVFRNASPDSMLQRKISEGIAQGEIPQAQLAFVAQRFMVAVPTSRTFADPSKVRKGADMQDRGDGGEKTEAEKAEEAAAKKKADEEAAAAEQKTKDDEAAAAAKKKADDDAAAAAIAEEQRKKDEAAAAAAGGDELTPEQRTKAFSALIETAEKPELETFAASFEERIAKAGLRLPGAAASTEREAEIRKEIGAADGEDTLAATKRVAARAAMGTRLFAQLVDDAVKARVSRGDTFDADKYRRHLTDSADAEYVQQELDAHDEARRARWRPGRVIDPGAEDAPIEDGDGRKREDGNVLASIAAPAKGSATTKGRPTYAVPAKNK